MVKNKKAKGSRVEREVKRLIQSYGFSVVRSAGSFGSADLYVEGLGSVQVKARKELGFLKWLDGADMLVVKQDRDKPYVVMELERFLRLVKELTNHDRG